MAGTTWSPRYLAYVAANGARTPQEMLRRDRKLWPGGVMAGFILWIGKRWSEWDRLHGWGRDHADFRTYEEHAAFSAWLTERWPPRSAGIVPHGTLTPPP